MASPDRLLFARPEKDELEERFLVLDGFGQPEGDPATHQVALSLEQAFPFVQVDAPIAAAETISDDTTVQLSFEHQAEKLRKALDVSEVPTHIYAYSQAGITAAAVLSGGSRRENIKSITFVGTPLDAEREQERVSRYAAPEMGGMFEYVYDQLPAHLALASLQSVVCFKPKKGDPRYVAITDEYMNSFPSTAQHISNLSDVAQSYPTTTLISAGAENMTDCTPINARTVGEVLDIPFADDYFDLDWRHQRQGIVIEGANHRLGEYNRTVTIPRIFRLRTHLAENALMLAAYR
jgi:hypothetical protein